MREILNYIYSKGLCRPAVLRSQLPDLALSNAVCFGYAIQIDVLKLNRKIKLIKNTTTQFYPVSLKEDNKVIKSGPWASTRVKMRVCRKVERLKISVMEG